MGWSHPDISLEDLMVLIRGFVDILILASGYQSSGLPASWDAHNIKSAIRWGRFFEEVFRRLRGSVYYEDSVKELDAALLKLTSDSCFPQGISRMSSATLSSATQLVLKHLLQAHPLKDAHLVAVLTAVIEIDIENLSKTDNDSTDVYADKLMLQMESLHLVPMAKCFVKDSEASLATVGFRISSSPQYTDCNPKMLTKSVGSKDCSFIDHSCFIIQELLKRQALVSCISSVDAVLDNLSNIFSRDIVVGSEKTHAKAKC